MVSQLLVDCNGPLAGSNMAAAFYPLPPPYSAAFPTMVIFLALVGAMGAKTKDKQLLQLFTVGSILWAVLAILYFTAMCIWVAQVGVRVSSPWLGGSLLSVS
jgi:hypothetical protein